MAKEKEPPFRNTFVSSTKAQQEARQTLNADLKERLAAKNILHPEEVGGDYDASRLLFTTMGGQLRPLTIQDLQAFSAEARRLGGKYKGGITAKQVINLSMPDDRDRANRQIHTAMPVTSKGGRVQLQTNAGPDSKVQRHQVIIEMLNYNAVIASPVPAAKVVGEMLRGPIKIECNCEHFRFVYRYIATIGKFNAGRAEPGFPKIKNPKLQGVACKHILRVMQLVTSSPTFKNYAIRMVEHGRQTLEAKSKTVRQKDMKDFAEAAKSNSWSQRKIRTTEEKQAARQKISVAELQGLARQKAAQKAERAKTSSIRNTTKAAESNIQKLVALGAITQVQAATMIAALKNGA